METLLEQWKREEEIAHIHGWDFSHIHGRFDEENDLPGIMKPLCGRTSRMK